MHWASKNLHPFLKKKRLTNPKPLEPFGHFNDFSSFGLPLSVSQHTVHLDFCVTLLFRAASSKKFPLEWASKCDHQTNQCLPWYAAGSCKTNPNLWPRTIAWEKCKGVHASLRLLPLICSKEKKKKIPPVKAQPSNCDCSRECRRNVHCCWFHCLMKRCSAVQLAGAELMTVILMFASKHFRPLPQQV